MTAAVIEQVIERDARLTAALATAPLDRLLAKYREFVIFGNGEENERKALRVAGELGRRGIAPVFRLPRDPLHEIDPIARQIVGLCDMQWIRHRYPQHTAAWSSMRGVFSSDPEKALKAWRFALWNGRRAPVHLVKGLGLTEAQVQEVAWMVPAYLGKVRRMIYDQRKHAAERIGVAMQAARDRRTEADKAATFVRRVALWECGLLANWKPARAAELFALMPSGEKLPRNIVGRHLDFVRHATGRQN